MRTIPLAVCLVALAAAGCSRDAEPSQASENGDVDASQGDESRLMLKEFMGHVMERNAEQLWGWTTYINNEGGARYTKPQAQQDWINAESDALTVQQLTYALEHSDYRIRDDKWAGHVRGLREAATASAEAAEKKDFGGMLVAAQRIDEQCVDCHLSYVPEIEGAPPNK